MTKARDLGDNAQNTKPKVVNAKGDLIVGTGSDAADRLAVSDNGSTLVADSAQTTGLRYNPPVGSLANPVINGGFDIWQRGTSGAIGTAATFVTDRWRGYRSSFVAGMTVSRQATGDTTNLPNLQYCLRGQRDSGNTGAQGYSIYQNVETANTIPFAGKAITLSFYARAGANYSPASSALNVYLFTGTGTDQDYLGTWTGSATIISSTATLTTTWQRFAFTGTIGATATEMAIRIGADSSVGTAGANDYFEVTGVQIDVGTWTASTAPTFRRAGGTIQGELAACQRYYYRITGTNNFSNICPAYTDATNNAVTQMTLPVEMRVAPTSVDYANIRVTNFSGAAAVTSASLSSAFNGKNNTGINLGVSGTPFTAFIAYHVSCNNNSAGYLGVSAEL